MRLPLARDCGDLLMFDEVRRRLSLGMPQVEDERTIAVADIVGTVGRAGDFDGCFRPRRPHLSRRVQQIRQANPVALNEAIDVLRIDRAYFVVDGHKRVSIARATGREFIDARVSSVPTVYELAPGVAPEAIDRTAFEQRFREETGLLTAVPAARFDVSEPEGYAELKEALESYGFELVQRIGRVLTREEAAAIWYESVYRPTVHAAHRQRLPELLRSCTETELFLTLHRQSRQLWGTECTPAADEAEHLVEKVMKVTPADDSVISQIVQRARRRRVPQLLPQRRSTAG